MTTVTDIVQAIQEIQIEAPRKMQERLGAIIKCLETDENVNTKASKARHLIEVLGDNEGVEAMTRTELFNVASMLETL